MGDAGLEEARPTDDPDPTSTPTGKDRHRLRDRVRNARSKAGDSKQGLIERAERERDQHVAVRAVFTLVEEDGGRGGGLLAGGLAYRLFIWLLPAALAVTSIFQLFADLDGGSPSETARTVGMGAALAGMIGRAAAQAGRAAPVPLVVGLVLMLWASRSVLKALRIVSAIAWGMRPGSLSASIVPTLATAGTLVLLGIYAPVLAPLYGGSLVTDVATTLLGTLGLVAIAVWGAANLPHPGRVRWVAFLPGAILWAAGLEILRLTTALYFAGKLERVDDLYGAIGFAAVFMAYLYLIARLAVLGFMANAAASRTGLTPGAHRLEGMSERSEP